MRIRTALPTLALTAAALAAGAGGAAADGPDVDVYNSSSTTFPGVCAGNPQFSFVAVPVNLLGQSDSSSCRTH